jgi:peptidoglycan hydrolase-like protein with peptidoglycan-binding domain
MWRSVVALSSVALAALACSLPGAGTPEAAALDQAVAETLTALAPTQGATIATHTPEVPTETPAATGTALPSATSTSEPTDTPPPTETPYVVPDWPLVRQGNEGPRVFAVQYLLRSQGHAITVDGIFGPQTRARVMDFQGDKGLVVDGLVGQQTWSALILGRTVRSGDTGDGVRAAQYLMRHRFGKQNVVVDGDFGPITDGAVRDVQGDYDLVVDGIVGPQTWRALVAIEP